MVTLEDLSNIIDNNVLHELYQARELALADITKNDGRHLKKLQDKEQEDYGALISEINNIEGVSR